MNNKLINTVIAISMILVVVGTFFYGKHIGQNENEVITEISSSESWYNEKLRIGWEEDKGYYFVIETYDDCSEEEQLTLSPEFKSMITFGDDVESFKNWLKVIWNTNETLAE